jgi:hypothetical protein
VLEADIQSFYDDLNRSQLRSFLDRRVRDGVIRRALDKWLKAGVMEGGNPQPPGHWNTAGRSHLSAAVEHLSSRGAGHVV